MRVTINKDGTWIKKKHIVFDPCSNCNSTTVIHDKRINPPITYCAGCNKPVDIMKAN